MIRIFFSWQSDVAPNSTTRSIRTAIATAANVATGRYSTQVVADEATRDVPGSPYIPFKLAEKIRGTDIFIADITTVASTTSAKSLPNPNVAFELGLAAAHIGWDRIILLFNEEIAEFKGLPFDFDRHRISRYKIAEAKKTNSSHQQALTKLITLAIDTIISKNPLRPRDLEGKSDSEIKRARDVANLRWFFQHMSVEMLGNHAREMPDMLHYYAPVMSDRLEDIVNSPSFHLYDTKFEKLLRSMVAQLAKSLRYDQHYRELNNIWVQAFGQPGPYRDVLMEMIAAEEIRKIVAALARDLKKVVATVHHNYLDIDLNETSKLFESEYRIIIKQTQENL